MECSAVGWSLDVDAVGKSRVGEVEVEALDGRQESRIRVPTIERGSEEEGRDGGGRWGEWKRGNTEGGRSESDCLILEYHNRRFWYGGNDPVDGRVVRFSHCTCRHLWPLAVYGTVQTVFVHQQGMTDIESKG